MDSHLHANNFQIVFAYNNYTTYFFMLYHRIDTMFGYAGLNIPGYYFREPHILSESKYMFGRNDISNLFWDVPPGVYVYNENMVMPSDRANTGKPVYRKLRQRRTQKVAKCSKES